jgi:hypothetical protein
MQQAMEMEQQAQEQAALAASQIFVEQLVSFPGSLVWLNFALTRLAFV